MNIVTGYLTIPYLKPKYFKRKIDRLERLNLECRVFERGIRRDKKIGPNGILFTGEVDISSSYIMKLVFGLNLEKIEGLTYDISSSFKSEDLEVKKLNLKDYKNYFGIRVKIENNEKEILDFNKRYLNSENKAFRYVEPNFVLYEFLTSENNIFNAIEKRVLELEKQKFNVKKEENTLICNLTNIR